MIEGPVLLSGIGKESVTSLLLLLFLDKKSSCVLSYLFCLNE